MSGQHARPIGGVGRDAVGEIGVAADKAQRLRRRLLPKALDFGRQQIRLRRGRRRAVALHDDGDRRRGDQHHQRQRDRGREHAARVDFAAASPPASDSSSTGSSVQADIDHSDVISVPLASAPTRGQQQRRPECRRRQPALRSSFGQIMSAMVGAARPRRDEHDDHRDRHIAGRAGEIAERADRGVGERLGRRARPWHSQTARNRAGTARADAARARRAPASDRDPRRGGAEINGAASVDQRRDREAGEQKHRPVFAQHAAGGADAGERGVNVLRV